MKIRSNRGFGLVIALAVIVVTGALGTFILQSLSRTVTQAGQTRDRRKAYFLARGGVEWVKSYPLTTTDPNVIDFWDFWRGVKRRAFRGGEIHVKVIDESARMNVDNLLRNGGDVGTAILKRLFASIALPGASQASLFTLGSRLGQKTQTGSSNGSAKGSDSTETAEVVRLLTVGEMRRAIGAPAEWETFAPYATVVSDGKVNVNRARSEVLAALFPFRGKEVAKAIIDGRSNNAYTSVSVLKNELQAKGFDTPDEAINRLATTSATVTVWSLGKVSRERQAVAATLRWLGGKWIVMSFKSAGFLEDLGDIVDGF